MKSQANVGIPLNKSFQPQNYDSKIIWWLFNGRYAFFFKQKLLHEYMHIYFFILLAPDEDIYVSNSFLSLLTRKIRAQAGRKINILNH